MNTNAPVDTAASQAARAAESYELTNKEKKRTLENAETASDEMEPESKKQRRANEGTGTVTPVNNDGLSLSVAAGDGNQVPVYNEKADPLDVFAMAFFYNGNVDMARSAGKERIAFFASNPCANMKDVADKFSTESGLAELAEGIGGRQSKVSIFLAQGKTVEQKLHETKGKVVALNQANEVETILDRWVYLARSDKIVSGALSVVTESTRASPTIVVLGSSGSGKSTLAVKDAAEYKAEERHQFSATLYLQPSKQGYFQKKPMHGEPRRMFNWIREQLEARYGSFTKLDMHISLVLDELGATQGFFEDLTNVQNVENILHEFASSVRLILCGTGVLATDLSSSSVAKCRLGSWETKNVSQVLAEKFEFTEIEAARVSSAIDLQPGLGSLLTNARAAYFLLSSLKTAAKSLDLSGEPVDKWIAIVNDRAPSLVGSVVTHYSKMNGLSKLDDTTRRHIAAWAFRAIERAVPGQKELPSYDGLDEKDKAAALAIIEQNIESQGEGLYFSDEKFERAILVTPALVIILYSLLGVRAEIFTSWDSQERISSLHIFRHKVVQLWEDFLLDEEPGNRKRLHDRLSNLKLVQMQKKVQGSQAALFYIPRLRDSDVCINGERASFADVIAKYLLVQCKHCDTKTSKVYVNYVDELRKCGLLGSQANADKQRIVLRVLFAIWNGSFNTTLSPERYEEKKNQQRRVLLLDKQVQSTAYPENLLECPRASDGLQYVAVKKLKGSWKIFDSGRSVELPAEFPPLTFVISTNAQTIVLKKSGGGSLEITEDDVYGERVSLTGYTQAQWNERMKGTLIEDSLSAVDADLWRNFKQQVMHQVTLKFLFTN
jgi:hypothetical protein